MSWAWLFIPNLPSGLTAGSSWYYSQAFHTLQQSFFVCAIALKGFNLKNKAIKNKSNIQIDNIDLIYVHLNHYNLSKKIAIKL